MLSSWVIEEMQEVDLEDKRLNDRLMMVLDQLSGRPTASIPEACGGYAETMAAYRFFDNEKVGFENILQPHIEATEKRMSDQPVVILAQDTTEIDLTRPEQQVVGAGRLDHGSRHGVLLHPQMGFTPDGTPLGTVYAETWTRPEESKSKRESKRRRTSIEDKESMRWIDSHREALRLASQIPRTHFVCVADSEADIFELLQESEEESQKLDWIVRACHDRVLQKDENHKETSEAHLRERVLSEEVLLTQSIHVRGRKTKVKCDKRARHQPRESRSAKVEIRAARVTLQAPWRHDRKLSNTSVNAVLVTEIDPPEVDTPIEWLLLTSLPINDASQVRTVIQYYRVRWMIEVFFRTLKSGCRVEARRFEHIDRMLPCLAVYLIVTWRTLFVCRLGREFPEISCQAVFEPAEWKSVYNVVHQKPPPPTPPSLREMVRMVAQLGGYINRKRNDEPGPQTVWIGLQRTHDIANCWLAFGPDTRKKQLLV